MHYSMNIHLPLPVRRVPVPISMHDNLPLFLPSKSEIFII